MPRTAMDYPRFEQYGPIRPHAVVAITDGICVVHSRYTNQAVALDSAETRGRWVAPILMLKRSVEEEAAQCAGAVYFVKKWRAEAREYEHFRRTLAERNQIAV